MSGPNTKEKISKNFRLSSLIRLVDPSGRSETLSNAIYYLFLSGALVLLLLPVLFAILLSLNPDNVWTISFSAFTLENYLEVFTSAEWISSFITTFQYSVLSTVIALLLSISASYAVGRFNFPYSNILSAATFLPLMIPQVILGLALLLYFQNFGLIGNVWSVALGLAVYATPYGISSILASMDKLNKSLEEAAMNLGADDIMTFRKITFPLLLPGLMTAAIFSFIVSFINLQITIFLRGPTMTPVPVRVFSQMEFGASPVIAAVATINIFIIVGFVIIVEYIFDVSDALGYT